MVPSRNNDSDVETTDGYRPLTSSLIRNTRLLTIEPVIACFILGDGIYFGIQSEYIQGRIASLHNYTLPNNVENGTCSANESGAENKLQTEIQSEASTWLMYFTVAYTLPSIFMTVIIGAWSDSVGRRSAILIPSVGSLFNIIAWALTAALELPLEILIASSFVRGLCGGTSLFVPACISYISDVTTKENRTPRIIVCESVILLSLGIANLCGGFLLDFLDFTITLTISACCIAMAIIYTTIPCLLRETIVTKNSFKENMKNSVNGLLNIMTKKDLEYKKTFFIINFVFFLITVISYAIFGLLSIHFLGEPFCFSFLLLSYYRAVVIFSPTLGLGIVLFLKRWPGRWLDDYWLLHLSMCSCILFFYVCAAAETSVGAFVGAGLGMFTSLFGPSCRSLVSKMSSPEEQGAVLGFLGTTDALAGLISPLILNNIYSVTVYSMPTFVFWMCGSFCLLPIISVGYLQFNNRIQKKKLLGLNYSDITPDNPGFNPSVN